jgi:serine protease
MTPPRIPILACATCLAALLLTGTAVEETGEAQGTGDVEDAHSADHVLVKLTPGSAAVRVDAGAVHLFDRWYRIPLPRGAGPKDFVEKLGGRPGVETATLDKVVRLDPMSPEAAGDPGASATPNDPLYPYQWHIPLIQTDEAWDQTTGSAVVVAVIDTGISRDGADLDCHTFVHPYNALTGTSGLAAAKDDNGHGTHVAGTVAQCTHNGIGVAGVAFDARLMPVKVLAGDGEGTASAIAAGIDWARAHGADVINLSLGLDCGSTTWPACSEPIINTAIEAAAAADIMLVAASGNDNRNEVSHPANHPDVIAIGAVDARPVLAPYSNRGSGLDLVAPGGNTSRDDTGDGFGDGVLQETFVGSDWGYWFFQGTSMASPHVAGGAALLRAKAPCANASEIRNALQETALDMGPPGFDSQHGHGLVQLTDAITPLVTPDKSPPCWRDGAKLTAPNITGTRVSLSWPAAVDNRSVTGYRILRDGTRIKTVAGTVTTLVVGGLTPATSYQFAVRPFDAAGNVGPALSLKVKTLDTVAPTWPGGAGLEVTVFGETSLTLKWDAAVDNVGVTAYRLRQAGTAGITVTGTTGTATGLAPGSEDDFEVLARDAGGNWSAPLTARVRTARAFTDTADSVFYDDILWLSGMDITRGCNPPANDQFCPDDSVTRGQMAAFLTRAFGLTAPNTDTFTDDNTSVFENDIEALAAAGITKGCNPPDNTQFCPNDPVTRGQMAAFLRRGVIFFEAVAVSPSDRQPFT